ncbi:putative Zn-dependent protease [Lipingzhangella halophila]|uniref:Putative Zn-dependent protease n=1 Tax=Lipingzhangella halophila TaxID=1783352 RepID=A0A7W7RGA7_9ACTN|nr:metallopeptidase TldD-related protein [Lipingzhangella halophila]MBB4931458.1 putative Zn-dependent protease [Lipingzhangella halophila]
MNLSSPQEIVERALELSRADGCMVLVREASTANLRWAGNSLTTNGVTRGREVTVIALTESAKGTSVGVTARSGLRGDDLADLVRAAETASRDAAPSEDARPLLGPESAGTGDTWDAPPATTSISVFSEFAPGLGRAFERRGAAGHLLYGYAEHSVTSTFLGSSTGLRLRHDQPSGTVDLNAKSAPPETGGGHSIWVGQATRDFTDIDVDGLDAELTRRMRWGARTVELPAGRYETLLPPAAVADMMISLYQSAGARDAAEGRTVFSAADGGTRVGERLSELPLSLRSDPAEPGLECAPFVLASTPGREITAFDNGLPLRRTDWISDGRLAALRQTRHSAELTGLPVTAHTDNLVLEQPDATGTLDDMIAGTERGLLLTCLWYIRPVDPQTLLLTGLTRDGVYLVEDGEVSGAVNNFRFNESPVSLLERVTETGATVPGLSRESGDYFPRTAMPPMRVPDFNMSTVSQAS